MKLNKVMVAGGGTLGSQIAWQTAFEGFDVVIYDPFEKGLEASKEFHDSFAELFSAERGASEAEIAATRARISYSTSIVEAVADADLVSESVPEIVEIKQQFYRDLSAAAPEKTIFTSNSSTFVPSQFLEFVDRPGKFLALHFANLIWDNNIGEVMRHPGTDSDVFETVAAFAKDIGMVPLRIEVEQPGYLINSLLVPWLNAAQSLITNGVSTPSDVEKSWLLISKSKYGPIATMDIIGFETIYNICLYWAEKNDDPQMLSNGEYIKQHFIDKGLLGAKTGQGYFSWPNPESLDPDFLK